MELKDFVSATLISIVEGVKEAQLKYDFTGGNRIVNPPLRVSRASKEPQSLSQLAVQTVEFDVAVSTSESSHGKGGIGLFVGAIGLGAQGSTGSANAQLSRIKFHVPISLPMQKA